MKATAAEFVLGTPEIQSLPEIFELVNRVIAKPSSSSEEIAKVVMQDPGLTTRLLRLINSSIFSFPGQIDTISRAISLVGTQQLRDLTLATCVIEMFEDISIEFVDMQSYWRHCLATAVCTTIGGSLRRRQRGTFLCSGLAARYRKHRDLPARRPEAQTTHESLYQ
ncbi:MAG: HDOD domain-containing protein [Myxococcales bacterium]|nr:HDOD domain-containing protein [Myxococcales bacterium]